MTLKSILSLVEDVMDLKRVLLPLGSKSLGGRVLARALVKYDIVVMGLVNWVCVVK